MAEKVRVDKWLWSVRIFKSRTLSADTVKDNKVRVNDKLVRPSFQVVQGDLVQVKKGGINFVFKVVQIIEKRVGAPIAHECYLDLTPEEEKNKFNDWFAGKTGNEHRDKGTGRPTKLDRREIDQFKDFYFDDGEEEKNEV